jgi:hypothetical protein
MFANYFGLPAISVPCGFDRCGLPIGLQVVAKAWDDGEVLHLAHHYQFTTNFHHQHPSLRQTEVSRSKADTETLLRRCYAAFNARDSERALARMRPDVTWPNAWEGG